MSDASNARLAGLGSMLGAVACFVTMAAAVKFLREGGLGTAEVMLWRMAPGLPWVYWILRRRGIPIRPKRPSVVGARCLFGGLAMAAYFWALTALTLLQHTVLYLAQPVFVAILAPLVVRERLRGAAVVALMLALAGAALVVVPEDLLRDPSIAQAHLDIPLLPALAGLASAVLSALAHVTIRRATSVRAGDRVGADAPEIIVFYFSLAVSVGGLVGSAIGGFEMLPSALEPIEAAALIAVMATTGVIGQLLLSRAYARTDAPAVAIVGYARIPLSMVADVVLWGVAAGLSGWLGAATMVVAGILLVRAGPKHDADPPRETSR